MRKTSKDFTQSDESNESNVSMSIFEPYNQEKLSDNYEKPPNIDPRYAKAIDDFNSPVTLNRFI